MERDDLKAPFRGGGGACQYHFIWREDEERKKSMSLRKGVPIQQWGNKSRVITKLRPPQKALPWVFKDRIRWPSFENR